jgi:hypothetical protein
MGMVSRDKTILLAATALSLAVIGCGSSGKGHADSPASAVTTTTGAASQTSSAPTPSGGYLINDADRDNDDPGYGDIGRENDDSRLLSEYGSPAGKAEKQAITAVVKRYFAAAAAGDGATACSLLTPSFVAGVVENAGTSAQDATAGCASSVSRLLAGQHEQLAEDEVATMVVIDVRIKHDFALAVLGFKNAPEAEILLQRDGHAWKLAALFDSELP